MADKKIYEELNKDYEYWDEDGIIFDELFDNENDSKRYVVCGRLGLWWGNPTGYKEKVFNSLKEALLSVCDGMGDLTVIEGAYGRLYAKYSHHDGVDYLQIRELTELGEEMLDNWYDVGTILKRKGATRNVKYLKNYGGV